MAHAAVLFGKEEIHKTQQDVVTIFFHIPPQFGLMDGYKVVNDSLSR